MSYSRREHADPNPPLKWRLSEPSVRNLTWLLVGMLLMLFVLLSLFSVRGESLTVDEPKHYQYGLQILHFDSNRLPSQVTTVDDSKMPITALNALPGRFAPHLPAGWLRKVASTVQGGRPVTIFFSAIFGLFLYLWAKQLYGKKAGLFTLLLYCLEPSIIAHSQLVTTDAYAMGTIMLATYAFWRWNRQPSILNLGIAASLLGISQLAKYSAVFLPALLVLMQIAHDTPSAIRWLRAHDYVSIRKLVRSRLLSAFAVAFVVLLIVNAGYFFNRTFTPLGAFPFQSAFFKAVQSKLAILHSIPIPLPYPYLQGLDLVKFRDAMGIGFGRIFMLGHLSDTGFPGFYLVDIALKTPIPTLLAIVIGTALLLNRRPSLSQFLENESFLVIPIVWYLFYMSFLLRAQLGIRLILVIFPFMLILAGNLARGITPRSWPRITLISVLSVWLCVSVMSYYPNFLAYFNELVPDRRTTYRYLTDSDLDWRQSRGYLKTWLSSHPDAKLDPTSPVVGTIVASPTLLDGVPRYQDPDEYAWLRDNFDPVDIIANTYPVFHVTGDDLKRLGYDTTP